MVNERDFSLVVLVLGNISNHYWSSNFINRLILFWLYAWTIRHDLNLSTFCLLTFGLPTWVSDYWKRQKLVRLNIGKYCYVRNASLHHRKLAPFCRRRLQHRLELDELQNAVGTKPIASPIPEVWGLEFWGFRSPYNFSCNLIFAVLHCLVQWPIIIKTPWFPNSLRCCNWEIIDF